MIHSVDDLNGEIPTCPECGNSFVVYDKEIIGYHWEISMGCPIHGGGDNNIKIYTEPDIEPEEAVRCATKHLKKAFEEIKKYRGEILG